MTSPSHAFPGHDIEPVSVELDTFEHGFPSGFGPGMWGKLAYGIAIAFTVFQLIIAAWHGLPSQAVRGIHVGFLLLLSFGLVANFRARNETERLAGWALGAIGFLAGFYQWMF